MGGQLSWESACLASRRSPVRSRYSPPNEVPDMGQQLSWLEHTTDNREVDGSSPFWPTTSKRSQREWISAKSDDGDEFEKGLESRLLATVRWTVATGVAFRQKSESTLAHHFKKRELTEASSKEDTSLSFFKGT